MQSDRVCTRVLMIELVMIISSLVLIVTLLAAHSATLVDVIMFCLVAMVVALPYNVFVSLLQVQCTVYEEQIEQHLAQIEEGAVQALSDVKEMVKRGETIFTLGVAVNCLVCTVLLVIDIVLVLYSKAGELQLMSYLGVSFFYTVVLMCQLVWGSGGCKV